MTGASKILTVSYGTFSCTLEGFDDPFNTMKAIAEYFRDLAAEDRYFGAEPPTPDAAMLHRIAEREIQRRVEAKIQDNGVVLRASDAVPAVAEAAPAVEVTPAVAAPVVAEAPVAAPAVVPSVAPEAPPAAESIVEKLSRLRSEVAAQPGTTGPAATVPFVSFAIPDYIEDAGVEDIGVDDILPAANLSASPVDADFLPESDASVEDAAAEPPLPEEIVAEEPDLPASLTAALAAPDVDLEVPPVAPEVVVEAADEPVAADDAVAAVLDAVAAEELAPGAEADAVVEPASAASANTDDVALAAVIGAISAEAERFGETETVAEDIAEGAKAAVFADEALIDDVDSEFSAVATDGPSGEDASPGAAVITAQDGIVADNASTPVPETAPVEEEEEEQAEPLFPGEEAAEEAEPAPAHAPAPRNEAIAAIFAPDTDEDAPASPAAGMNGRPDLRPGAAEKLQRARARVIRIRRGEEADPAPVAAMPRAPTTAPMADEAQVAEVVDEANGLPSIFAEVEPEQEKPTAQPVSDRNAAEEVRALLSAEDEAELQRELAALRAADEEAEAGARDEAEDDAPAAQDARKALESASADEAMGRLMQQTTTEMEGPETKRRQSAIAHLKAAVAATVAERQVTGDKPTEERSVSRLARYRNDLAMVVKSALPSRSGDSAPAERPAPLVLVSEQRIDRRRNAPSAAPSAAPSIAAVAAQPQPSGIRPRRVSSAGLAMHASPAEIFDDEDEDDVGNLFGETKGFAEFAERVGATTLEEMLEASAAYLSGVEGRTHFTRPQLMWHVGTLVPAGTYQREDGLRSFGTLLRDGRIAKVRRGQFALSEESPYLAEAKKIAG